MRDAGGRIIVSPNTHAPVIEAAAAAGLVSLPGFFTPSEAFAALRAGATGLKLFPAEGAAPAVVKAQRAVLPKDVPLLVVGGISPGNMQPWLDAGADGFGLGSGLYKPGQSAAETAAKARAYVEGVRGCARPPFGRDLAQRRLRLGEGGLVVDVEPPAGADIPGEGAPASARAWTPSESEPVPPAARLARSASNRAGPAMKMPVSIAS